MPVDGLMDEFKIASFQTATKIREATETKTIKPVTITHNTASSSIQSKAIERTGLGLHFDTRS